MKLEVSNENYAASIVLVENPRKHSNADRLLCWTVNYNNVISDLSTREGLMVYFPVECKIAHKLLSENSLYQDVELNSNKEKKGYIAKNGRVRAMKLRGEYSEGLILPLSCLSGYGDISSLKLGDIFNTLDGQEVCEKFIPKVPNSGGPKGGGPQESIYAFVDGQFAFHKDTNHFGRNVHKFDLDDVISISYKLHGTSFTARRILKKRKWWIFNLPPKYEFVVSSRKKILRSREDGKYSVWMEAGERLKSVIPNGLALYGEIVGFNATGGAIQGGYDYGCCSQGHTGPSNESYIYRITYTSPEGLVIEYSAQQVQEFCQKFGLKTPPLFYIGTVKNFCIANGIDITKDSWRDGFATLLKHLYNEKDCFMCKNSVPEEGVVIRKEGLEFDAFKLKSSRFLLKETEALDAGEEVLS